jgi:tetratricopeptide (TPR) repeat protein
MKLIKIRYFKAKTKRFFEKQQLILFMMTIRKCLLLAVLCLPTMLVRGQATSIFTESQRAFKRGEDFFNQALYGLAQKEFAEVIQKVRPVNEPAWENLKTDAQLQYAKCAVRLKQPEATKLVEDFLRDNSPSPQASQAALEVANYYFDSKEYEKALDYYALTPRGGMAREQQLEIRFKEGYAYFLQKKFTQAKSAFSQVKEMSGSEYFFPANYYFGCCSFFEQKYADATKSFQRCEASPKYKGLVPYYLCQIYFAQKQYDTVISYGAPKAKDANIKNSAELNMLVGQAYFEKGDYKNALPYLEFGAKNVGNLRPSDYYQVGYAQYQTGNYKQAITNFENLTKQDSLLGQNGLYHLGDCYLKSSQKSAARNAFGQASQMNFDKEVRDESMFNYAKLSYELKYDRDAITALQSFPPESKFYPDAQALMGEIFLNTRDYDRAITTIEGLKTRTSRIDETYQQVCYLRGLQLIQDKNLVGAEKYFQKALIKTPDDKTEALTNYWLGDISHKNNEFDKSKSYLSNFIRGAKGQTLPAESSLAMGNYTQGYNFLKTKDYSSALTFFTDAVNGLKKGGGDAKGAVLGDAVLRVGDCHFKKNQYDSALKYYNEAINNKYNGFVYALYQKAVIEGLKGNTVDKIIALEKLVQNYPNSEFTDEALLQIGTTYQEIGKLDQAIPPLKKLVADFKGKSNLINEALNRLGLISYNQGNTSAAINYYKQVFANNPDASESKDALAALEEIYVKDLGKPDEYFAFLETVPGYKVEAGEKEGVTFNAAESQYENGNYDRAVDGFTAYLAKYPNAANTTKAYYHRGESYSATKKYSLALKDYAYVVNKGGQSNFYVKALQKAASLAYTHEKDYAQAFEFYKKLETAESTDELRYEAQLGALRCAYRLNKQAEVYVYANKVINSGNAAKEQLAAANFYLGKVAFDQKDWAKALPAFKKVVDLSNNESTAESRYNIAYIYYQQRNLDAAEKQCEDANKDNSAYPDWIARSLILLSDIYVERKDYFSAKATLEGLIDNYPGDNAAIKTEAKQKLDKVNSLNGTQNIRRSDPKPNGLLEMDEKN